MADRTRKQEESTLKKELDSVLEKVYKLLSTDRSEVFGRKRYPNIVTARYVTFHILHNHGKIKKADIARMGPWSNSAVKYGLKRYKAVLEDDWSLSKPKDPSYGHLLDCIGALRKENKHGIDRQSKAPDRKGADQLTGEPR